LFVKEYLLKIVLLPGDGIGKDVTCEVSKLLEVLDKKCSLSLEVKSFDCGGEYYLKHGIEWPDGTFETCRDWSDAIFLGAVGWPGAVLEDGDPAGKNVLFGLRLGLDLYANIRPVKLLEGVTHRVHSRRVNVWQPDEVDLVIFRENTEGLYCPAHGYLERRGVKEVAIDNRIITRKGCLRIIRKAFIHAVERAERSGKTPHVTCVDKSNVLDGCRLFRSIFKEVALEYPLVETDFRYIDAFCQALLWEPGSFDVCVLANLFGDIASDVAAVPGGGLGMAPSGECGDDWALFEPVHGSAPPLAGTGKANPLGAIRSALMMLYWCGTQKEGCSAAIGAGDYLSLAIDTLIAEKKVLPEELGGSSSTSEIGDELVRIISSL
jgi:3-isopropylmalate dehydrogenase